MHDEVTIILLVIVGFGLLTLLLVHLPPFKKFGEKLVRKVLSRDNLTIENFNKKEQYNIGVSYGCVYMGTITSIVFAFFGRTDMLTLTIAFILFGIIYYQLQIINYFKRIKLLLDKTEQKQPIKEDGK